MKSTTNKKWLVWSVAAVLVILIIALCALRHPLISSRIYVTKAMKVLHSVSANPSRTYKGIAVGGFIYQLNGPLAEGDLRKITKDLGLTEYDPGKHGALSEPLLKDLVSDPLWSNEASGFDHFYFRNSLEDRFVVRAKWDNGQIYFLAKRPGFGG